MDTSVINRLAEGSNDANLLIAGLKSGYLIRIPATSVDELIATKAPNKRETLLNTCREFLKGQTCQILQPPHWILERMIQGFDSQKSFDWRVVSIRAHDYEREVVVREIIDNQLSEEQREYQSGMEGQFATVFRDARPHFEELFREFPNSRSSSVSDLVTSLQVSGGAFWELGKQLCEKITRKSSSQSNIEAFVRACPPFHTVMLSFVVAQYHRCISPDEGKNEAGRNDLMMSAYLPYCQEFISDDWNQQRSLKEVVSIANLSVNVRWYKDLRDSLLANPLPSRCI